MFRSKSEAKIILMASPSGIETYRWLCDKAVENAKAEGWKIQEAREPTHPLGCQGFKCGHGVVS